MTPEEIWRRKSDDDLRVAAERLDEYTDEGRRIIRAELERRSSPEYLIEQEALESQIVDETRESVAARPIQRHQTTWLVQRAALAVALMIGFYVFALGIAFVLLSIPIAEWSYLHRIDLRIAAACFGAGLAVLWALVPRTDTFEPPGPRLDDATHPQLFRVIRDVAAATAQAEPADVYLLNDVNAWVAHRGGTMGFGSRRVMGIGLPLLQAVSLGEFKAIIAHEFGHYSSGDVKLGPWVYKTRAAIGRTVAGVHGTFIEAPFQWYGRQFLKLTHAVSRQQEFIADQVAVRVAGSADFANALRRVTALAPAYSSYLQGEVLPVLNAGFLPPIAGGFDEFLRADSIAEASQRFVDIAETDGRTDVFDTHPSLRDRLAALNQTEDVCGASAGEPARVLVGDVDKQARSLVEFAWGRETVERLKPIDWNVVGETVFASEWRTTAKKYSKWLGQFSADSLPSGQHAFIHIGSGLVRSDELNVNSGDRIARATYLLAVGIGAVLLDQGWKAYTRPGMPVQFVRGSDTFEPFAGVRALAEGVTTPDAWKAQCRALGIEGLPLGDPAAKGGTTRIAPMITAIRSPEMIHRPVTEVNCYRCKRAIPVNDKNRGKTFTCPQCGTKQELPR
jgi:heat shock protein HtpX